MPIIRNKFDFEIGYLIKSPCKACNQREEFPVCLDNCAVLDEIQTILAQGISCSRSISAAEPFVLAHRSRNEITR